MTCTDAFFELSDEEVFAHTSDESVTDQDDDDHDHDQDGIRPDRDDGEQYSAQPRASSRHKSTPYEEESDASKQPDDDDDAGGWGVSKTDYYNADQIETEADALEEEAEAIRLQKKQLQRMTDTDFGLDEADWIDTKNGTNTASQERGGIFREVLPQLEIADDVGDEERTKILYARYPEFRHLSQEYLTLQAAHNDLKAKVAEAIAVQSRLEQHVRKDSGESTQLNVSDIVTLKYTSLSAYLGAICIYFALLTAPGEDQNSKLRPMNPNELHDHSIMEHLLTCRNAWQKVEHMIEPDLSTVAAESPPRQNGEPISGSNRKTKAIPDSAPKVVNRIRKSKAQKAHEAAIAQARAERVARIQRAEEDLKKLYLEPFTSAKNSSGQAEQLLDLPMVDEGSDFGEETHLNEHDAEEKAKRKKSLQFYTSQIAQKASKRGAASRAAGGDDDIPYKERLRDRQERLNEEAEKRGKKGRDVSALTAGMDDSSGDENQAQGVLEVEQSGSDEYYEEMIARPAAVKAARKAKKTAEYQANLAAEAEANGDRVVAIEQVGPDGKRAIGYTIEKNKGLAPHRKKDVRNPRVKKRKKFEEKKKKQRNMRPVYKGGEGRGGYGGELTGIKKGIIKSIKL